MSPDFKYIEYGIIGIFILAQIIVAAFLFLRLIFYKNIFKNAPEVLSKMTTIKRLNSGNIRSILYQSKEEEIGEKIEISFLDETIRNPVMKNIVEPINNYLVKNKSIAIDFHILKDIVDRNVEIVEEDIGNRVPAPLYIGLAATMLGIIFGLFAVKFDIGQTDANLALEAMKPLINGVKLAMSASVIGLILTTVFSVWLFKNAKVKVEEDKNKFLSVLQSELMPKMNRSKLPEVAILSQKLDEFSRKTVGVVSDLGKLVAKSESSITREQQIIRDIKALDVREISSMNLDTFDKLRQMMDSFENFKKYYEYLDKSLLNTTKLVQNLEKFVSNTEHITHILNDLKNISSKSDQSAQFFNQHIQSFSKYGEAVNEAVADSDSKMSKAIDVLGKTAEKQFAAFNEILAEYDAKLSTSFDNSIERFNETMKLQAEKTMTTFESARPKFEKLNQLDKLNTIEQRLGKLESGIISALNSNNNELIRVLKVAQNNNSNNTVFREAINKEEEKDEPVKKWITKTMFGLKVSSYVIIILTGVIICYSILF